MSILLFAEGNTYAAEVRGSYLVKFESGITFDRAVEILEGSGLSFKRSIREISVYVTEAADPVAFERFGSKLLLSRSEVVYIEPNFEWKAIEAESGLLLSPNDSLFSQQDGLIRTAAERAWNTVTGSRSVIVATTDSGISASHPDLINQLWINSSETPGNGIDDDGNGYVDDLNGWDFVTQDNDPSDLNRHGTHVSGIIGAQGNNGLGISGMNWNVSLLTARFLDAQGSGTTDAGADAIIYAATNGARLINASWGGGPASNVLRDAITFAYQRGALFIAAAGNDSRNNDSTPSYPASYDLPGVISVASSAANGSLSSFSNFGRTSVHLAAPGTDILSTLLGGQYGRLSGTSMAAPMISGAGALILSQAPGLTALELRNAILNAVDARSD